jgi:hypothetical protein
MKNFRKLNSEEYDKAWDMFYDLFHFKPSINEFPAISTEKIQLKFNISKCFSEDFPFDKLEQFAIDLFTSISKPGDRLYALDWQHECYDFDPRMQPDRNDFDEWIVPALPNGDYYIFLTKDFNNVWFGHPWERTITLIGDDIVKQGRLLNNGLFTVL